MQVGVTKNLHKNFEHHNSSWSWFNFYTINNWGT